MSERELRRVEVADRRLADYVDAAGADVVERIRDLAEPVTGARVLHVNATPYGGGVAEHLSSHVPLMRDLGIDAQWCVLELSDAFVEVTKALHNGLQGMDVRWDEEKKRIYAEVVHSHAAAFSGDWDLVVVHDPQPAALLAFLDELGDWHRSARWVWRCHIDLTTADADTWSFLDPYVSSYDATVWTMEQFVPQTFDGQHVHFFPPCIDPLAPKNVELPEGFIAEACARHGIDTARPIVLQVSRFDRWKDPVGVIDAFRSIRQAVPGAQLVLVGSMAQDDPEGPAYWELAERTAEGIPGICMLSGLDDREVNALQRSADVVMQKSLREGFGLTVSEALWKRRPVIGGRVGGITLQIREGVDGYLVDSPEEAAARTIALLHDEDMAGRMGASGHERVRERFLVTRELQDYLGLLAAAPSPGRP